MSLQKNPRHRRPDFTHESFYWRKGYRLVVGVDEVGRGSIAGPVVAATTVWPAQIAKDRLLKRNILDLGIDDSKRLTAKKREKLTKIIKKLTPGWGIGKGSVREIDSYGIVKATEKAMRRAIRKTLEIGNWKLEIPKRTMFVLVDGFHVKYIPAVGLKNQKGIPHGDQKSLGIAAASILAKDYRDGLMRKLSLRYPQYGWDQNKGYGTKRHRLAISRYGRTPLHRKKFVETFLKES